MDDADPLVNKSPLLCIRQLHLVALRLFRAPEYSRSYRFALQILALQILALKILAPLSTRAPFLSAP